MKDKIIQWMIETPWFRKYNSIIGGFCAGLWFQAHYWQEIKATLEAWGIPTNDYMSALLLIAGASGITISVLTSMANNKQVVAMKDTIKQYQTDTSEAVKLAKGLIDE